MFASTKISQVLTDMVARWQHFTVAAAALMSFPHGVLHGAGYYSQHPRAGVPWILTDDRPL